VSSSLVAPFPYFGGKKSIADLVWKLIGSPRNYIEPFAGSAAVLLRRPDAGTVETLNDTSHWICNFWRAVKSDPSTVARYADSPVSECDLHARHLALMNPESGLDRVASDPDYFDAKLAGWWVWGQCLWIGGGWCLQGHQNNKRPNLGHRGGRGLFRHLGDVNDWGSETTEARTAFITDWVASLSNRLRNVRVCCGNWSRVCSSDTVLGELGTVGMFLDPPYATDLDRLAEWKAALAKGQSVGVKKTRCGNRSKSLYLGDSSDVDRLVADVNLWCHAFGSDKNNRIVVCGLDGEHNDLESVGWKSIAWLPNGGYSNLSASSPNSRRERLWASPACLELV
jgi:hypothetical protein